MKDRREITEEEIRPYVDAVRTRRVNDLVSKFWKTCGRKDDPAVVAFALALCLGKWHPSNPRRGMNSCACCVLAYHRNGIRSCDGCPVVVDGRGCNEEGHPWKEWSRRNGYDGHAAADKVYALILKRYLEFYDRIEREAR